MRVIRTFPVVTSTSKRASVPFLAGGSGLLDEPPPPHPVRSGRSIRGRRERDGRVVKRYMALHSIGSADRDEDAMCGEQGGCPERFYDLYRRLPCAHGPLLYPFPERIPVIIGVCGA
jgi:hypothetical protein